MESEHLSAQVKDLREALKQLSETLAAAAAPKPVKREFTRVVGEVGVDTDRRVTELLNDGWEIVSDQMVISPELPVNGGRNDWVKITNTCLVREVPVDDEPVEQKPLLSGGPGEGASPAGPVDGPHPPAPDPKPAQAPEEEPRPAARADEAEEADWKPVKPTSPSVPVDGPAPSPKPAQAPEEEPRPAARVVTGALVMPPHDRKPKQPLYYQHFTDSDLFEIAEIHRRAERRQQQENEFIQRCIREVESERVG